MVFEITEQVLRQIEKADSYPIEDILAIMTDDIYQDMKNHGFEKGYEMLAVSDEQVFVDKLVKLMISLGRVYKNNSELFSGEARQRRLQNAKKKTAEIDAKLDAISNDIRELENEISSCERKQAEYGSLEDLKIGLEEKLQTQKDMIRQLEAKHAEGEALDYEIRLLKNQRIPAAQKVIDHLLDEKRTYEAELTDLETTIEERKYENQSLLERNHQSKISLDELEQQIEELKLQKAELLDDLQQAAQTKIDTESEIEATEGEIRRLKSETEEKRLKIEALGRDIKYQKELWNQVEYEKVKLELDLGLEKQKNLEHAGIRDELVTALENERRLTEEADGLKKQKEESEAKAGELSETIHGLHSDLDALDEKISEMERDYISKMNAVKDARVRRTKQYSKTMLAVSNHKELLEKYRKDAQWLSSCIASMLGSENELGAYDFMMDENIGQLTKAIKANEKRVRESLDREMELMTQLLESLDT